MNVMKKGRFVLALPIMLAVVQLSAEPPQPPQPEKIRLSVVAICAHNRDDRIDPRLTCMADEIKKAVPQLTGFKMGKMSRKEVPVGGRETFELVDDQVATVTVVQAADKENLIQIKLTPPQMGEVTYETSCGRFFTIITKYRTRNKEVLILAVRVQPCQK
jgi:hypothetical protein